MLNKIASIAAILALLSIQAFAFSQHVPPFSQHVPTPEVVLPEIGVDLQDLVSVLAEYSIVQEDNPTFCSLYFGLTDFHTRTISICSRTDLALRQHTVIHEVLHILYMRQGLFTGGPYEPAIDARAKELFKRIFGNNAEKAQKQ